MKRVGGRDNWWGRSFRRCVLDNDAAPRPAVAVAVPEAEGVEPRGGRGGECVAYLHVVGDGVAKEQKGAGAKWWWRRTVDASERKEKTQTTHLARRHNAVLLFPNKFLCEGCVKRVGGIIGGVIYMICGEKKGGENVFFFVWYNHHLQKKGKKNVSVEGGGWGGERESQRKIPQFYLDLVRRGGAKQQCDSAAGEA